MRIYACALKICYCLTNVKMEEKMKKIIATVMATAMCLTAGLASACGNKNTNYAEEAPMYSTEKELYINSWIGVSEGVPKFGENGKVVWEISEQLPKFERKFTDEEIEAQFKAVKDAGFNYIDCGLYCYNADYYKKMLSIAEKYGLKMMVVSQYLRDVIKTDNEENLVNALKSFGIMDEQGNISSAFGGVRIKDEPTPGQIASIYHKGIDTFQKVCGKDKMFLVNLFPRIYKGFYENEDRLNGKFLEDKYREYLREYVEYIGDKEGYICYDHYPLRHTNGINVLEEDFLYNMMMVKQEAPNLKMYSFLQCISFFNGANRDLTSVADAGFQAYSLLAMGAEGISWFCYGTPEKHDGSTNFTDGCVDHEGKTTKNYEFVKTINNELRAFEDIFLSFTWKNAMTVIGSENERGGRNTAFSYIKPVTIKEHERISAVSTQQDTLVGVFKDAEGRDGFMFVNYTEPSKQLEDKVSVTFNDCAHALVVKNGVAEDVHAKDGVIEFTLKAGEGYFVIPLK